MHNFKTLGNTSCKDALRIALLFLLATCIYSCNSDSGMAYELPNQAPAEALKVHADSIKIVGDPGNFTVDKVVSVEGDLQFITYTFTADAPSELQPQSIQFKFPSIDINGFWNPKISIDKVNYYYMGISSKASRYAPVLSFYNNALNNRLTLSLSDALNQSEIASYLKEEDVYFYQEIKLFDEKMPKTTSYSITIRIDTRPLPYYQIIDDVASWWVNDCNYEPMYVPEAAKKPMYSTWYSYHQNISAEEII